MSLENIQLKLKDNITLLPLTPQSAIFGFLKADCHCYLIQNNTSYFETVHIKVQKKSKFLSSTCLLKEISKVENTEKKIASVNEKKHRI